MQLQRQHIHFFFFFFFSFWAFKVCSHISLITFKMHQWEGGVMIELPWLEIKRRSGVDGLRLGGRKGIWLLNDHVKQSPPAPPFLHPISPPPPLPPPASTTLHSPPHPWLHPDMLTHHAHAQMRHRHHQTHARF